MSTPDTRTPTKSEFDHGVRLNRVQRQISLAEQLAPAFRDKYDFSSDEDFTRWAELAHKAAGALITRGSKAIEDESARFSKEREEEQKRELEARK